MLSLGILFTPGLNTNKTQVKSIQLWILDSELRFWFPSPSEKGLGLSVVVRVGRGGG